MPAPGKSATRAADIRMKYQSWKEVGVTSKLKLVFLKIVHSGTIHCVKEAPVGKKEEATVLVHEHYLCYEVDDNGMPTKKLFGSPRAISEVNLTYEEVPGKPGIWRKKATTRALLVPKDFTGELIINTREGQTQKANPGDAISIDGQGCCNVITAEEFAKNHCIVE